MNVIFRVSAALALLAASLPALAASATVTREFQFKPGSVAGFTAKNLVGDIRVERGAGPGVQVTARATVEADSEAEAGRLAGLVEYRTRDTGSDARLEVRLPPAHFPRVYWAGGAANWWSASYAQYLGERVRMSGRRADSVAVRVDLVIRAPEGASVEADLVFGNGSAEGFSGKLKLDGGSGTLHSAAGEGEAVLDNGSGEVTVAGHRGRVVADTGSGAVRIADCQCEIVADTGSGSVNVERGAGSVSADTGSGRVDVRDFSGSFVADTGSGSVQGSGLSNVEKLEMDTASGSVTIEGDLSALRRLHIDTGSGSVRLRSSAQPSMVIRIDTGSGGVNVDAPAATVTESDDVWTVRMRDGSGHGDIDTGSGGVELSFR